MIERSRPSRAITRIAPVPATPRWDLCLLALLGMLGLASALTPAVRRG